MLHRLVGFDDTQTRHADRSRRTDFRQIVAQQIDDHHVLGLILFAFTQFVLREEIRFRSMPSPPSPFDRPRLDHSLLHANESLRRSTRNHPIVVSEVSRERCRVQFSQPQIQRERVFANGKQQPLRQIHLKDVSRADVFDDSFDGLQIFVSRKVAAARAKRTACQDVGYVFNVPLSLTF